MKHVKKTLAVLGILLLIGSQGSAMIASYIQWAACYTKCAKHCKDYYDPYGEGANQVAIEGCTRGCMYGCTYPSP